MGIASKYFEEISDIGKDLNFQSGVLEELLKEIDLDDVFTGDWTTNRVAEELDLVREDLRMVQNCIDTAVEEILDILGGERK